VHVIGAGPSHTTGPVDVTDSIFTINHSMNKTELAAVAADQYGWVRNVLRNTAINNGRWPGTAFWTWRAGAAATAITFERNSTLRTGDSGIAIQELNYNDACPAVTIRYNYIEEADQSDMLDTEALRLRTFNSCTSVDASYNIINRTKPGSNSHPGIYLYGATGASVHGNTVYGTDDGILVKAASVNNDIRNNISAFNRQHGISVQDTSTVAIAGNDLFYANTAGSYSGIGAAAGDVTSDPKFVSSNPNSPTSFVLEAGSPAINAGVDLGARSAGLQPGSSWPGNVLTVDQNLYGGWEIGAFVYVGP
jgi:parallel beta-helix repeat protein